MENTLTRLQYQRYAITIHAICVLATAIIIALIFWALLPESFRRDDSTDYLYFYEPVARNLILGNGVTRSNIELAIQNPPGYPILLAVVFELARILQLPESLLHSLFTLLSLGLSSMFVFLLSRSIWCSLRAGWISALFFMTYPFILWLAQQPASEIPFMVFFYACLVAFWRGLQSRRHAWLFFVLAGVLAGLAMLVRGIAIGLAVMLCCLLLVLRQVRFKQRLVLASLLLLANCVTLLPWQGYVYHHTGEFVLLGTNGVPSMRDGLTFAAISKDYRVDYGLPPDLVALQTQLAQELSSADTMSSIVQVISGHLAAQPTMVVKLYLLKLARAWYGTDSGNLESAILLVQLLYGIVISLACVTLWRHRAHHPGLLLFVWSIVVYFWIMTTLVLSILRYMVPTFGLLFLLLPGLVQYLLPRLARH